MVEDPYETTNIVDQRPGRQAELAELWNEWNAGNMQNVRLRPEDYGPKRQQFFDELFEESQLQAREKQPYTIE